MFAHICAVFAHGRIAMIEAISCGGVVIFRGKILLLYKNYRNRYEGWVLPKGTVEQGEEYKDTAIREVLEETGATATIIQYVGKSQYSFTIPEDTVEKSVHWYLMMGESYYSKPQREEYFTDSGYYKYHEAYHLLKFSNEKQILEKAYNEYLDLKKSNLWGTVFVSGLSGIAACKCGGTDFCHLAYESGFLRRCAGFRGKTCTDA